jgi:hypothetical protein
VAGTDQLLPSFVTVSREEVKKQAAKKADMPPKIGPLCLRGGDMIPSALGMKWSAEKGHSTFFLMILTKSEKIAFFPQPTRE